MAKGFSPLIGLAAVVALALVAVFGSIGLSNPAWAATSQPADSQLAEREFTPQDATVTVAQGEQVTVDVTDRINGGGANYASAGTVGIAPAGLVTNDVSVISGFNSIGVQLTGSRGATGSGRVTIPITLNDGSSQTLRIDVTVVAGTDISATGAIADMDLAVGGSIKLDVAPYFQPGKGAATTVNVTGYAGSSTAVDSRNLAFTNATGGASEITIGAGDAQAGDSFYVTVTATQADNKTANQTFFVDVVAAGATGDIGDRATLTPDSYDPGENTGYTVVFAANADITSGVDDITVELEDFGVPNSISSSDVTVSVTGKYTEAGIQDDTEDSTTITNTAGGVAVDGEKVIITLKVASDDFVNVVKSGSPVTIVFRAGAGISNPTEGGKYGAPASGTDEDVQVTIDGAKDIPVNEVEILRTLGVDPDEDGRGAIVTATGKGFKNGTTLLVFLDVDGNNRLGNNDHTLCRTVVGGDDVGSCQFELTNPPFKGGDNTISAVDGRSQYPSAGETDTLTLEPSLSVTPGGGTPGDNMLVQLQDFAEGGVSRIRIARQDICNDSPAAGATLPNGGAIPNCNQTTGNSFQVIIPDWVPDGTVDFRVDATDNQGIGQDASALLEITGPVVTSNPGQVLANQRISLSGDGFTDGSRIAKITLGGEEIASSRINGGVDVNVDNGGSWSAAVNLPLTSATTSGGPRQLQVTDSGGRTGTTVVNIPERTVTITPESGRVGTVATVRGENFPARNDDGSSFNVSITYDAGSGETTVSAISNASGSFEAQLRVPTSADIPSTNTVTVKFDDADDITVVTTVTHQVPEGRITLSQTSGLPGTSVNITGEGFKAWSPVQSVHVGNIEVTPSPAPSTTALGTLDFDIQIPGLEDGIQTIELQISGTTASAGFTVTQTDILGAPTPAATAVAPMGDNFVRVFNFSNDTKTWSFYDPRPEAADANTLENFITGRVYHILVSGDQEVILNNETRNLTCIGDNCWNLVVW